MKLNIKFQPKQGMFDYLMENSKASWMGYGGSRGGAKSGAARRIMVRRRLTYPGTSGQILRRVWDDVEKNHVNKMWEEFPELHQYYKSGAHVIEMPNGSRIFFDSAENQIDVERKGYGPEYMDIMVDQAEQFTEEELVQLKTTCRWPGMDVYKCKFGLYFNPGGVSSAFLQRVFHTHDYHEAEMPDDYVFLQAYGWDNVEWCRAALLTDGLTEEEFYSWDNDKRFEYYITRAQYGIEQNALPAHKRAGQLLGSFAKFEGQYFSNFDPSVHAWDTDEVNLQPYWPRWISHDWGFGHHAVTLWHCQGGYTDSNGKLKRLVITYREQINQGLSERALAEEICAANDGEVIQNIFGGHDLWRKDSRGSKESAMSNVFRGHGLPRMKQAKIDRVDGWQFLYTALDEGEWIITKDCKELIKAIPTAVFDKKKNNEDILKTNTLADDLLDCARYGLFTQYSPAAVPEGVRFKQQVSHLVDPTSRAIQLMKLGADRDKRIRSMGQVNSRSAAKFNRFGGNRLVGMRRAS